MKKEILILMVFLTLILLTGIVFAEKIQIDVKNNYLPGENVNFIIFLYDDNGNAIDGEVDFNIKDTYTEIKGNGKTKSGEEINFQLPQDASKGYWEVSAEYKSFNSKALFNVGELEKAEITLEGDKLIIKNIGNIPYKKSIQIAIGEHKETALVPLDVRQKKEIKLTAPAGEYTVKVNDGTQKEDIIFSGVSLTGNAIGLENLTNGSFWKKYPLVSLFLGTVFFVMMIIVFLKLGRKYLGY
jgi:hypothetical protein